MKQKVKILGWALFAVVAMGLNACSDSSYESSSDDDYYWENGRCMVEKDDTEWVVESYLCEGYYLEDGVCYDDDDDAVNISYCRNLPGYQNSNLNCVWQGQVVDSSYCYSQQNNTGVYNQNGYYNNQGVVPGQQQTQKPCVDAQGRPLPQQQCQRNGQGYNNNYQGMYNRQNQELNSGLVLGAALTGLVYQLVN